jgi:hypothetical protein
MAKNCGLRRLTPLRRLRRLRVILGTSTLTVAGEA